MTVEKMIKWSRYFSSPHIRHFQFHTFWNRIIKNASSSGCALLIYHYRNSSIYIIKYGWGMCDLTEKSNHRARGELCQKDTRQLSLMVTADILFIMEASSAAKFYFSKLENIFRRMYICTYPSGWVYSKMRRTLFIDAISNL